jgi:hypothetical protein
MKVKGRSERRYKQLFYDFKEKKGKWKLKKEALDRTLWRTRFGRGYGPVVKTDYGMDEYISYTHTCRIPTFRGSMVLPVLR